MSAARHRAGMTLVELLVAAGLASIVLLGLVRLVDSLPPVEKTDRA